MKPPMNKALKIKYAVPMDNSSPRNIVKVADRIIQLSKTKLTPIGLISNSFIAIIAGGVNKIMANAGFNPLIDIIAINEKNAMLAHSVGRFFHLICNSPNIISVANSKIIFS
tara:strand:+ start:42 stop:377 length:336 start_codon:yes stop_codon:yes gene_type:complete